MAGLQGAGKTTTVAKLAKLLKERAQEEGDGRQRRRLSSGRDRAAEDARRAGRRRCSSVRRRRRSRCDIARAAIDDARKHYADVLIVDTAGRLHVDEAMMAEIKALHAAVDPVETLFVVDAMTGQDAVNTAQAFGEALPLDRRRADQDRRRRARRRGAVGAPHHRQADQVRRRRREDRRRSSCSIPTASPRASSAWATCCRWSSRSSSRSINDKAEKLAEKVTKGKRFDLNDLRDQLEQMQNMGGLAALMDKLPGIGADAASHMAPGQRQGSARA